MQQEVHELTVLMLAWILSAICLEYKDGTDDLWPDPAIESGGRLRPAPVGHRPRFRPKVLIGHRIGDAQSGQRRAS